MSEIKTSDDLIRIFDLDPGIYYEAIAFKEEIGFSVKRKYENSIRHRAIKGVSDEEVRSCCFYISLDEGNIQGHVHHLTIRVFTWVGGWTDLEQREKRTLFYPVDLTSTDEYVYAGHPFNTLAHDSRPISGRNILEILYQKHLLPTRPIKGWILRKRLWLPKAVYTAINLVMAGLKIGLKLTTGRKIVYQDKNEFDRFYEDYFHDPIKPYTRKDIVLEKGEEIKALNYNTTKPVLISGAIAIIFLLLILNLTSVREIELKGETLVYLVTPILVFWIFDTLLPLVILRVCNWLIALKIRVCFRQIEI